MSWVDVLASVDLGEGGRAIVERPSPIALARVEGRVYAIDNRCPHRDGELGRGELDGYHLYCPLHAWCFDVRSGAAFFPQGARVEAFETKEEHGRIWVRRRLGRPTVGP